MSTKPESERVDDPASREKWGPYLSERAWGTVRGDYSARGNAWGYFPHAGDTGAGLGASHQTGWTGLVAHLIIRARS